MYKIKYDAIGLSQVMLSVINPLRLFVRVKRYSKEECAKRAEEDYDNNTEWEYHLTEKNCEHFATMIVETLCVLSTDHMFLSYFALC